MAAAEQNFIKTKVVQNVNSRKIERQADRKIDGQTERQIERLFSLVDPNVRKTSQTTDRMTEKQNDRIAGQLKSPLLLPQSFSEKSIPITEHPETPCSINTKQ